jgi:hypothetical protein
MKERSESELKRLSAMSYARQKRWRKRHPEKALQRVKQWQSKNRSKHLENRRKWRLKHRERENARTSQWRLRNKDKVRAYARKHRIERMESDLNFAIKERLRNRIKSALVCGSKVSSTMSLLGCSIPSLKIYLESKFETGMSWENWGFGQDKWNVDHIMPLCIFDLTKPEHQKRAFHFSNLQPLWQVDNLKKRATPPSTHQFGML